MLKVQELKELIKALDQSNLDELKFEQEGTKLVLKKQQAPVNAVEKIVEVTKEAPQVTAAPSVTEVVTEAPQKEAQQEQKTVAANIHTITSPMVGTFYAAPSPDSAPYVTLGDQVNAESVVCIVEAMKLMNEIEAEVKGKIVEVLAENGELVEYGQPLFVVELV
ncbi:biotin carboxyl carrier protein of acetyl-CoA carboxylase [Halalkalibacter wakoensis JCM 9140]|uniref:Biotin carboxyl carrier protein of acetyl-CoA carboxylase n=1 Tax=Halalkalibacter wakoensis JCM 9140 TaxID=1236970 RepID=W4PXM2_9BACI|nr:acetyl-CoA carboxylase biotin carboxyl carrier protein [Halalkalibacter wakoensis]GAE24601.1 biotin carboxyl carrier protein of acetyl-CoA carboxylase [Halalkalibacter wakoensis JCM 9140]